MTERLDVRLATCSRLPQGDPETSDLAAFLNDSGVSTAVAPWNADIDWSGSRLCVIRSTWDYHRQLDSFLAWCEHASNHTSLWNHAALIRWNSHKRYLLDLEQRGIPIVPSKVVERGRTAEFEKAATSFGIGSIVVKHAVSLDGEGLCRTSPSTTAGALELLDHADVLIQPYVRSVAEDGEISAVFVDGEFVHAVRKRAAPGEFRVQERYGGRTERTTIEPAYLQLAKNVMSVVGQPTLYSRVDMVRWQDEPCLGELELIEPSLYLRASPETRTPLLRAILRRLKAG